jgi:hypothetical protein
MYSGLAVDLIVDNLVLFVSEDFLLSKPNQDIFRSVTTRDFEFIPKGFNSTNITYQQLINNKTYQLTSPYDVGFK